MLGLIKELITKFLGSYMEFFEKISSINIVLRIIGIPVFTFVYILTFFTLLLIVLTIILLVLPISFIYKPHLGKSSLD